MDRFEGRGRQAVEVGCDPASPCPLEAPHSEMQGPANAPSAGRGGAPQSGGSCPAARSQNGLAFGRRAGDHAPSAGARKRWYGLSRTRGMRLARSRKRAGHDPPGGRSSSTAPCSTTCRWSRAPESIGTHASPGGQSVPPGPVLRAARGCRALTPRLGPLMDLPAATDAR